MRRNSKRALCMLALFVMANAAVTAAPVSKESATNAARQFLSQRGIAAQLSQLPQSSRMMMPGKATPAYYAFNVGENEGFVVVSGDDRTEEVLGYSDHGTFNDEKMPENMRAWLQGYADQIKWMDEQGITTQQARKAIAKSHRAMRHAVPALLTTTWDQGEPFNQSLPTYQDTQYQSGTAFTGCVATAMAQVMYYHRWPQGKMPEGIPAYSYTYYDSNYSQNYKTYSGSRKAKSAITFDWDNMLDTYGYGYEDENAKAVATLMDYCGASVEMTYGLGSGAQASKVAPALKKYFGYGEGTRYLLRSDFTAEGWQDVILDELYAGRPVIYGGLSSGGGHEFVCDGYSGSGYFHINWGWSGENDGFFLLSVLNPMDISGAGASSTYDGFTYSQDITIVVPQGGSGESTSKYLMAEGLALNAEGTISSNKLSNYIITTDNVWSVYNTTGTFNLSIGIEDEKGNLTQAPTHSVYYMSNNRSTSLDSYKFQSGEGCMQTVYWKFTTSNLANGTYKAMPICKKSTDSKWTKCAGCDFNYVEIVVSGGKVTSVKQMPDVSGFTFESMEVYGAKKTNTTNFVYVNLTNNNKEEYNGMMYLWDGTSATSKGNSYIAMTGAYIKAGGSKELEFFYVPQKTGKRCLVVTTDPQGKNVIGSDYVTIEASSSSSSSYLYQTPTVVSFASTQDTYLGPTADFKLKVRGNSAGGYNCPFYVLVFTDPNGSLENSNSMVGYGSVQDVNVEANKETTIDINIVNGGMPYGQTLYAKPAYYGVNAAKTQLELKLFANTVCTFTCNEAVIEYSGSGMRFVDPTNYKASDEALSVIFDEISGDVVAQPGSNPNTIYYAKEDQNVSGIDVNLVKGKTAEHVVLVDGYNYYPISDFNAKKIDFKRTFEKGNSGKGDGWETFMLPFSCKTVTIGDDQTPIDWFRSADDQTSQELQKFYLFSLASDDEGQLNYDYAKEIIPTQPYIIAVPGNRWGEQWNMVGKEITFSADNVRMTTNNICSTNGDNYYFRAYNYYVQVADCYMLNEDGTSFVKQDTALVAPFRAFVKTFDASLYAKYDQLGINRGNVTPTGIATPDVKGLQADEELFDLQGRRMEAMPAKGIYVKGGKKYVVK